MLAAVIMVRNPFCPDRDREVCPVLSPVNITQWLDDQGIADFDRPTICLHNGKAVLRPDWSTTVIADGDVVHFRFNV